MVMERLCRAVYQCSQHAHFKSESQREFFLLPLGLNTPPFTTPPFFAQHSDLHFEFCHHAQISAFELLPLLQAIAAEQRSPSRGIFLKVPPCMSLTYWEKSYRLQIRVFWKITMTRKISVHETLPG